MSKNCPIMSRMKSNYENRYRFFLTRRTPVIIRIDGKAFHTYTRNLEKPFDEGLIQDMQQTTLFLCKQIQGAKLGYTQSDEISILITDYDTLTTEGWFDYNIQKIVSISASLATGIFNNLRLKRRIVNMAVGCGIYDSDFNNYFLANFDSRCFNIPKEEIVNYFLVRQKDAIKNSVSMLAQSLYSHKQLEGKNSNQLQEMCFEKGCNWNDLDFSKKRGSTIIKEEDGWKSVETPLKFEQSYFEKFM